MSLRLLQKLGEHARRTPDAPAARDLARDSVLTYGQLAAAVATTAAALSRNVSPGDVVLLACPNDPRFHVAFLAILAAGGRAFPISPDSTPAELAAAAQRSGAVAVMGTDAALSALNVRSKSPLPEHRPTDAHRGLQLVARDTSRAGLLLQSSGTTGLPKIV